MADRTISLFFSAMTDLAHTAGIATKIDSVPISVVMHAACHPTFLAE